MLIDSNILIYVTQPEHGALRRWIVQTLPKVSVISKVEVLGSIGYDLRSRQRSKPCWMHWRSYYPSPATFEIALQLRQHRKLTLGDALIAATCIEHGFTLATHNTADFDWLNEINIIDPLGAIR